MEATPLTFPRLRAPEENEKQDNEGVKDLKFPEILQESFIYLLVGKPNSGKSHLINEFILNPDLYYEKFNKIVFVSPSRTHSEINIADDFYSPILTEDYILGIIEKISAVTREHPEKRYNFLFVFDDCVSALNELGKESLLTNLFFNRRHIIPNSTISIIVTTQETKSISNEIRAVVTGIFLFQPSPKELEYLKSEHVIDKELLEQFVFIMKEYFDPAKYEFFYIELLPKLELYYNFLKVY